MKIQSRSVFKTMHKPSYFGTVGSLCIMALCLLVLQSCGSKDDTLQEDSIARIQKREGIPVQVHTVQEQTVEKVRRFSGHVKGIQQKDVYAAVPEFIKRQHAKVGQRVRRGQVIITLDTAGNSPQYRQAKAQANVAQATYERLLAVFEKGGVSQQQLDQAHAQHLAAKAAMDAVQKMFYVQSPISGVITDYYAREGEMAPFGDGAPPLFQVAQIAKVTLQLNVGSKDIHLFKKGQQARVIAQDTLWGTVQSVPLAASRMSRLFTVDVDFTNTHLQLLPNMYTSADVVVGSDTNPALPIEALQQNQSEYFVWVVNDSKATKMPVQPVLMGNDFFTYQPEPVSPPVGASIVIHGAELLTENALVKVVGEN